MCPGPSALWTAISAPMTRFVNSLSAGFGSISSSTYASESDIAQSLSFSVFSVSSVAPSSLPMRPKQIRNACVFVCQSRLHEEPVAQTIEISQDRRGNRTILREFDDQALGAPLARPSNVQPRG